MQLSPEQFHTLFDRAAQPVLLVQDGVITQCSSRAEGLIAPGSPIRELLPPDAVLQELIAAAPTVLPLRLRTGYVTAQVQPLEGALLLFLPVGDDDACTSALSRAAQAVSAPLTTLLSASGTIFPLLADVEDPVLQRNLARDRHEIPLAVLIPADGSGHFDIRRCVRDGLGADIGVEVSLLHGGLGLLSAADGEDNYKRRRGDNEQPFHGDAAGEMKGFEGWKFRKFGKFHVCPPPCPLIRLMDGMRAGGGKEGRVEKKKRVQGAKCAPCTQLVRSPQ